MSTSDYLSIRRHLLIGGSIVLVLVGGIGGWAVSTDISGAVIAPGMLVVDSNIKKVQHPTGGIVGEILARDGDKVRSGDVLICLDQTLTNASRAIVVKSLHELYARKSRLEAELHDADTVTFPTEDHADFGHTKESVAAMESEAKLFTSRRASRANKKAQLSKRIDQLRLEIKGQAVQERAKAREIELVKKELEGARSLWDKNLMSVTKMTALEREATRLEGELGRSVATIAQLEGHVAEIELQILQIGTDFVAEVGNDLRDANFKIGELVERRIAAEDQLKRVDIRAPQDGMVFQSAVHTVGGVIIAGEPIMLIVPNSEKMVVEAKVGTQDIDQIHHGQSATLRFSAFHHGTTPEINGSVSRVSADAVTDERSGLSFYTVRISFKKSEVERLGDVQLIPSMPVEAFIQTDSQRVIAYLIKPMMDQIARAFRDR